MNNFEHRVAHNITDFNYDKSGNAYINEDIDGTPIWNVPESTRFIKPETLLDEQNKQVLLDIIKDSLPHKKETGETIELDSFFATCRSPKLPSSGIPTEILIGKVVDKDGRLKVKGNITISAHDLTDFSNPSIIGFNILETDETRPIQINEKRISGTALEPERYQSILNALKTLTKDKTIPHPSTKEYSRFTKEFKNLSKLFEQHGLKEIEGAMFKLEGEAETLDDTIVAVHPYYLEYHDSFGQRDKMSLEQRKNLMKKYDVLFKQHKGPLVIVEEENKILETLKKIKEIGRENDTYFVITENEISSIFPFTTNPEFMTLLKGLGIENLKFVGGHDAGDKPYSSYDPATGETMTYSGCLRGLANRIEKRGFPKIETMPGYTYS